MLSRNCTTTSLTSRESCSSARASSLKLVGARRGVGALPEEARNARRTSGGSAASAPAACSLARVAREKPPTEASNEASREASTSAPFSFRSSAPAVSSSSFPFSGENPRLGISLLFIFRSSFNIILFSSCLKFSLHNTTLFPSSEITNLNKIY